MVVSRWELDHHARGAQQRWNQITQLPAFSVDLALGRVDYSHRVPVGNIYPYGRPPAARGEYQPMTLVDIGKEYVWRSGFVYMSEVEWTSILPFTTQMKVIRDRVKAAIGDGDLQDVAHVWETEVNLPNRINEGMVQDGMMGLCQMIVKEALAADYEPVPDILDLSAGGSEEMNDKIDVVLVHGEEQWTGWTEVASYGEGKQDIQRLRMFEECVGQTLERAEKLFAQQLPRRFLVSLVFGGESVRVFKFHRSAVAPPLDNHNCFSLHSPDVAFNNWGDGLDAVVAWVLAKPEHLGFV